jgi:hypothetical protein
MTAHEDDALLSRMAEWAADGYPGAVKEPGPDLVWSSHPVTLLGTAVAWVAMRMIDRLTARKPRAPKYTPEEIAAFLATEDTRAIPYLLKACESDDATARHTFRTAAYRLMMRLPEGSAPFSPTSRERLFRICMFSDPDAEADMIIAVLYAFRQTGDRMAVSVAQHWAKMKAKTPNAHRVRDAGAETATHLYALSRRAGEERTLLRPSGGQEEALLRPAGSTPERDLRRC